MFRRTTFDRRVRKPMVVNRVRPTFEIFEDRALPSTCTVVNLGDTGTGNGLEGDLRYCLNLANTNGESDNRVEFAAGLNGTISLELGELTILQPIEIDGPDAALLTIDAGFESGIFNIPQMAGAITVGLDDLTLTRGTGAAYSSWHEGGGFFNYLGDVTLSRVTVTGNVVDDGLSGSGGGIANLFGTMLLESCVVSNNVVASGGVGGGIDNVGGTVTLVDSVVSGNRAKNFAGISNRGTLSVIRGTITGNVAEESGGGIHSLGIVTVVDSTITKNVAPGGGAGIYNVSGTVTVRDTTIADNRGTGIHTSGWTEISGSTIAGNHGERGGAFFVYGGTLRVTNSTISGNSSSNDGGAISIVSFENVPESIVQLTACTITDNIALGGVWGKDGGGIEIVIKTGVAARVIMDSCIVAGNKSAGTGPDVHGPVISLGYNFIGNGQDSSGWAVKDNVGTPTMPLDPKLAPLGDYGGKTWTHAIPAGSPAIKKGDPGLSGSYDQRGTWRQPYFNPDPGAFQTSEAIKFQTAAPSRTIAGLPFRMTLIALDADGNRATLGLGTVHFTSTDDAAQLPADYVFKSEDLGLHTFFVTLNTVGTQQVTIEETDGFPSVTTTIEVKEGSGRANYLSIDDPDWLSDSFSKRRAFGARILRR